GLMKACRLAAEAGDMSRAADLARQAHALDPARVEADPLVYKMHLLAGAAAKGSAEGCEPCPRCPHVRAPGQGDIEAPASMCCPDRPPADPKVVPARSPEDYPLCGPGEGQEVSTPDAAAGDFERLLDTLLESHGTAEDGLDFG